MKFLLEDSLQTSRKNLLTHLTHWMWIHHLYTYDSSHLVIADSYFISWVRKARSMPVKVQFATPEAYEGAITPDIAKIMIFTEGKELQLVNKLKAEYPDKIVVSGTYGYACVGRDRYSRLYPFSEAMPEKADQKILLLSTPYADAEFVAHSMDQNGLPYPHEFLARPFENWIKLQHNFQISRFYNQVQGRFSKNKTLAWLLQTDVLQSLLDHTDLSLAKFIKFLIKEDVKVILVSRSNQFVQAGLGQFLSRTAERSVWTKKPTKKMDMKYQPNDFLGCVQQYSKIKSGQKLLNDIQSSELETLSLTLEGFIGNQSDQLAAIASFCQLSLPDQIEEADYWQAYENATCLLDMTNEYSKDYIDRVGLHMSS